MHPDDLQIELAQLAAEIAAESAVAVARTGAFDRFALRRVEDRLERIAELCRMAGADIAETVFQRCRDDLAEIRQQLGPARLGE